MRCTIHPIVQRRKQRPERSSPPLAGEMVTYWAETQAPAFVLTPFYHNPSGSCDSGPAFGRDLDVQRI